MIREGSPSAMSETTSSPCGEGPTTPATDSIENTAMIMTKEEGLMCNDGESARPSDEDENAALDDLGQELKRTAERNPRDFFAQTAYARYHADIGGDARVAVFYFNKALKLVDIHKQPEMVNSYVHTIGCLAEALEGMKLYDKAEQSYAAALRLKPDDAHCLGSYAVYLHRIKKDYAAAEAMYKKAVTLYPSHASVLTKYANFLKNVNNDMAEAERYYRKAVEAAPTNADCLGSYAVFLHGQKKDEKLAEEYYRRALEADPAHVNILSNYGLYLAEVRKDLSGAKAVYERALALDPAHSNCLYNYAVLYDSSFRVADRAEQLYRRALKYNPRHAYALYNLAILLEERAAEHGELSQVRTLFEKAVAAAPGDAMTLADFGRFVFVRERNHKLAEEVLQRALSVDPDYGPALFYMGMVLLNGKNQTHEAEKHFRRCLSTTPGHSGANQYLARILAQDKRRRQHAAEFYQKALDATPTSVELLLEFSRFLAESRRNADKDKARELYRRACELSQNASRVGKPSRLGNVHMLSRPCGPSGQGSQVDLSKVGLSGARCAKSSALRSSPGDSKGVEEPSADAEAVLWQTSSASSLDSVQSPSCLWRLRKAGEVGPNRRAPTLPPHAGASQDGIATLRRRHAQSLSDGLPRHRREEGPEAQEGADNATWMVRRRKRLTCLPTPGLVVSASAPSAALFSGAAGEAEASGGVEGTEPRQEGPSIPSSTPPVAGSTTTPSSKEPEEAAAGGSGGGGKERKANAARVWERLPSRGDGVTGWGDEPVSPTGGDVRRRTVRNMLEQRTSPTL